MASRRYLPSDSIYCPLCGRPMAGPSFSCGRLMAGRTEVSPFQIHLLSSLWAPDGWPSFSYGRLTAGRTEVPIPINPSFRLRRPRPTPPPSLFSFCPRHSTHSADYNSNILCRIPDHQLALIPSIIIPTTDYVLRLEHEKLRCGDGIHKHT